MRAQRKTFLGENSILGKRPGEKLESEYTLNNSVTTIRVAQGENPRHKKRKSLTEIFFL